MPAGDITVGGEGRGMTLLCGSDSLIVPSGSLTAVWAGPMVFFGARCRLSACLLEESISCRLLCLQPVLCLLASNTELLEDSFGFNLGKNQVMFDKCA